jgi:hypothetical protein
MIGIVGMGAPSALAQTTTTTTTTTSTVPTTTTTTTSTTIAPTTTSTTTTSTSTTTSTTTTTAPRTSPGIPQNVVAVLSGTAQITLNWQPPAQLGAPALNMYKIVRLEIVGNASTTFPAITVPSTQLSLVFNDLRAGASYSFYVRAENANGAGQNTAFTNPLFVPGPTTTQAPAPSGPAGVSLSVVEGRLRVTWTPPTNSPVAIGRYRVTTSPNAGSIIVDANTVGVTLGVPKTGVTYTARVSSIGVNGRESAAVNSNTIAIAATVTTAPPNTLLPLPGQPPTPPGKPQPCVKTSWPKSVYNRPRAFAAGAQTGVYMWHDGRYWQVRVYHPGPGPVTFSGNVQANTKVTFLGVGLERGDRLSRTKTAASFATTSNYDIDGFRISASCATLLQFAFYVNGAPLAPSQIFVGRSSNAASNGFQIVR